MRGKGILNRDNIWGTLFIFFSLALVAFVPINNSVIDPLKDAIEEIELTDLVFSNPDLRPETKADPDIVLINIGNLDREGIAEEVNIINQFQPKVVGVDVFFRKKASPEGDKKLVEALSKVSNLVMVSKPFNFNEKTSQYEGVQTSDSIFLSNCSLGSATFITNSEQQEDIKICRTFNPYFSIKGQDNQLAFGVKLVQLYKGESVIKFLKRKNEFETINYRGNLGVKFAYLDVENVFNYNFTPDLIKDKIVIFGYLGSYVGHPSWEDKFFTPLNSRYIGRANPDMFGAVIHANIASMILNEDYINVVPEWLTLILTVIVCFLNVAFFSWIYRNKEFYYTVLTKPIQLIEITLLLAIIILLFHYFNLKVNLSVMFVTILLAGDMLELYYNFIKQTVETFKQKFLKRSWNYSSFSTKSSPGDFTKIDSL